ncbi:LUD domain-containing protein [Salinirubellus sp. GCM10025818]|uniref:LUD domain-containing protein n=1 Tax=Salinirubellus TaxID=2162630 RepID=UPI0030CAFDEC
MSRSTRRKAAEIRHLMETEGDAMYHNTRVLNEGRYEGIEAFDEYEDLRAEARSIKEAAIADLPNLIEQVRESVEANGGNVYLAEDAADANAYIEEVCEGRDAESVVKSKSMTTEEIELNGHLESLGIDVYETDLGEFVIQLADEAPSHIVAPGFHKSREEIATLLNETYDLEDPLETSQEMTWFVRDVLGEHIRDADVGVTGANFVLAESGTVTLVTNEGNARKTAVTPDTHVAVAGVEKLIPSTEELSPFVELIARAATGQSIAQYVTMLSPPTDSPTLDFDAPDEPIEGGSEDREFHLVLLDNGRTAMREDDELRETLYCIRCGACSNSCANFQHVGGHGFGGETYSGGIGTGWEAGVHGLDSAAEFNDLCTGCSRCVNACPVKIDIPWINTVVRERVKRGTDPDTFDHLVDGLTPDQEEPGFDLRNRFFGNFETAAKAGSALAPLSNWVANSGPVRGAMDRWLGIDRRRDLPEFRRETLRKWFEDREGPTRTRAGTGVDREVVLYPDVYTNHVQVERGKAAVRVLEALGVDVRIPDVGESGRAPLSQGMVSTAERSARDAYAALSGHLYAGRDVVVVEPSDLAMFRREYEKFLSDGSYERLAANSYEVMEYVYGLLENGADADALAAGDGERLAYHSHCQQRTLGLETYTEAVLEGLDYDVTTSDAECCGMAGSFGYKSEYYELSASVGESLLAEFDTQGRWVVASGTSCLEQLEGLLDRPTAHPIQVVDPVRTGP